MVENWNVFIVPSRPPTYPVKVQYLCPDHPEPPEAVQSEEDDEDHHHQAAGGARVVCGGCVLGGGVIVPPLVLVIPVSNKLSSNYFLLIKSTFIPIFSLYPLSLVLCMPLMSSVT